MSASASATRSSKVAAGGHAFDANVLPIVEFPIMEFPIIVDLRESGHTLQGIADQLNADGYATARATQRWLAWTPTAVSVVPPAVLLMAARPAIGTCKRRWMPCIGAAGSLRLCGLWVTRLWDYATRTIRHTAAPCRCTCGRTVSPQAEWIVAAKIPKTNTRSAVPNRARGSTAGKETCIARATAQPQFVTYTCANRCPSLVQG